VENNDAEMLEVNKIYCGDVRELSDQLDSNSVNCIITSPPYITYKK